jgi:hypothetical protein
VLVNHGGKLAADNPFANGIFPTPTAGSADRKLAREEALPATAAGYFSGGSP